MATCNVQSLMDDANCFFTLPTDGQIEAVKLTLLCQILQALDPMATCDVQTLMTSAKCFMPAALGGMAKAMELQLLCEISAAIGGTGSGLTFSTGTGSPEGVVTGSPGDTYWDTDTNFYYVKVTGSATDTGWAIH